jgi:cytochrome c2
MRKTQIENQTKNKKMKAQEKFEMMIETLNNLGCGEVEFRTLNCTGGRIEKDASLTVGPNLITVVFRPSGYLHPRTSCKVFAYVRGEKSNFDYWVRFVRSTYCA